jgi:phosphate transport system protein
MTRETLDRKLNSLLADIQSLEELVEKATTGAVEALKRQDQAAAQKIYDDDKIINTRRFDLENDCVITIATQQPIMAGDLRLVASILEVAGELERMGDYAKGIAKICLLIGKEPLIKPLIDIPRMAEITLSMLRRAVSAFINHDVDLARSIPDDDSQVDDLYNQVYRELIMLMFSRPTTIDQANHLMWAAHNLERMADRVTNICERAVYVVTGEMKEVDQTDDEMDPLSHGRGG